MFRRPHLILLSCFVFAGLVLIFIRFSYTTPLLLIFDLINLGGRGADTVSIRLIGFWVCN